MVSFKFHTIASNPEIQCPVSRSGECKVKVTNLSPNLRNVAPPPLHEIERREEGKTTGPNFPAVKTMLKTAENPVQKTADRDRR